MKTKWIAALLLTIAAAGRCEDWRVEWSSDPTCQLVFQAVLEGLYADGVQNEAVDLIIPPGDNEYKQFTKHFVYSCPLCHPAYEAFRLYRKRSDRFFGYKGKKDTFGKGLSTAMIQCLKSEKRVERIAAIQELIRGWVTRRLETMRLTKAEREDIGHKLELRMKQGVEALHAFQRGEHGQVEYKDWEGCAICNGSVEAGMPGVVLPTK